MHSSAPRTRPGVHLFDTCRALLVAALLLAPLAGLANTKACAVVFKGAPLPERQTRALQAALDLTSEKLPMPPFTVREAEDDAGTSGNIWTHELALARTASDGMVAHEVGHLIFIELIRTKAPTAFAALAAEHAQIAKALEARRTRGETTPIEGGPLDALINAYAEQFCDLVGLLATGRPSIFAGTVWELLQADRNWQNESVYPWEKPGGSDNFVRSRAMEYRRMGEFRRLLWKEHHDVLFGKKDERRKLLRLVGRAMAKEIETTFATSMTDRERNRRLIHRLAKNL